MGEHICVVLDYGWIIEGNVASRAGDVIRLVDASVVRKWNNGRGIGGIAKAEYKGEYMLDAIGDVTVYASRVLFEIPLEW